LSSLLCTVPLPSPTRPPPSFLLSFCLQLTAPPHIYTLSLHDALPISYSDLKDEENIIEFYQDKGVNVVIPQAGAFSYYTDWVESPENNYLWQENIKWETFLTKELPQALESAINGNGKRAIAGMSMSATSALVLAEHNPGFYDAVGSFSGCAATSRPFPNLFANLTVNRGGGDTTQMWGPQGGEYNV